MYGFILELDFDVDKECEDIEKKAREAEYRTAEIVYAEEVARQLFPFSSGATQNDDTNIQQEDGYSEIVTQNPYARRLYYHPEFNFFRGKNANAGGLWHEKIPKEFIERTYKNFL